MDDALVPDWIRRIASDEAREKAKRDFEANRQLLAETTIKTDGPDFFKQSVKEISIAINGLSLISLAGKVSPLSTSEVESGYQVSVFLVGVFPKKTYTNIFCTKGDGSIRCHPVDGESFRLYFCVSPEGGIGVVSKTDGEPMTPEEVAKFIVERMVKIVRS